MNLTTNTPGWFTFTITNFLSISVNMGAVLLIAVLLFGLIVLAKLMLGGKGRPRRR